jgi:hypothetical protein
MSQSYKRAHKGHDYDGDHESRGERRLRKMQAGIQPIRWDVWQEVERITPRKQPKQTRTHD